MLKMGRLCKRVLSNYNLTKRFLRNLAKAHEYSWWDSFGLESAKCRHALCECDAMAARCFKKAKYNDLFVNYDQAKC